MKGLYILLIGIFFSGMVTLRTENSEAQMIPELFNVTRLGSAVEVYEGNGTIKVLALKGFYEMADWLSVDRYLASGYNLSEVIPGDNRIFVILENP